MYKKLYEKWLQEISDSSLSSLSDAFLNDIAREISETRVVLAKSTDRITERLIEQKLKNMEYMLQDLLDVRLSKIMNYVFSNTDIDLSLITLDESQYFERMKRAYSDYFDFVNNISSGTTLEPSVEKETVAEPEKMLVLFHKDYPAIMGADMISYGPFSKGDIVILPSLNAKILIKNGIADLVILD